MSYIARYSSEAIKRQQEEARRLLAQTECRQLIEALRGRLEGINDANLLDAARTELARTVHDIREIGPEIQLDPHASLLRLSDTRDSLETSLARAEGVVRGWEEERIRTEARMKSLASRMNVSPGPRGPETLACHASMTRRFAAQNHREFHRTADELESLLNKEAERMAFDLAQKRVVKALIRYLKAAGYHVQPPIRQQSSVVAEGTSRDGQRVRVVIPNEDIIEVDHDSSDEGSCRDFYERFQTFLDGESDGSVEPLQVVWKNPDRRSGSARPLPPPPKSRSR